MSEQRFVSIKLLNPQRVGLIYFLFVGPFFVLTGVVTYMQEDGWLGVVIGFVCGTGLIGLGVYGLVSKHAIALDRETDRLCLYPSGKEWSLDQIECIHVWRYQGVDSNRLRMRGTVHTLYGVYLGLSDGQEFKLVESSRREKMRDLAERLSVLIDKPWVGGRNARSRP